MHTHTHALKLHTCTHTHADTYAHTHAHAGPHPHMYVHTQTHVHTPRGTKQRQGYRHKRTGWGKFKSSRTTANGMHLSVRSPPTARLFLEPSGRPVRGPQRDASLASPEPSGPGSANALTSARHLAPPLPGPVAPVFPDLLKHALAFRVNTICGAGRAHVTRGQRLDVSATASLSRGRSRPVGKKRRFGAEAKFNSSS